MSKTLTVKFHDDADTKQTPWAAIKDIKERDARCVNLYTADEQVAGADMLAKAREVFIRSRCFLNFRDTVMVVKVEKVAASDKLSSGFDAFQRAMADLGAVENHRNGHYNYHLFPRK